MLDLYITTVGEFGEQVADRLVLRHGGRVSRATETYDPSRWPRSRIHVVATWRETPSLFDLADRVATATGRPWLPITLDAASVRVGPLLAGREGPCYRCFLGRQYQHRRLRDIDRKLFQQYDANPALGVGGFLRAHVSLAAAAARPAVEAVLDGRPGPVRGQIRRFGLLTPQVSADTLVAVHGCDRCSRPEPGSTYRRLAADLRGLQEVRA